MAKKINLLIYTLISILALSTIVYSDTEILRPNSIGDFKQWTNVSCTGSDDKWQCIDEEVLDTNDYVRIGNDDKIGLFKFEDINFTDEVINSIKVSYVSMLNWNLNNSCFDPIFRSTSNDNFIMNGSRICTDSNWTQYDRVFTVNPITGLDWTIQDINDLELGMISTGPNGGGRVSQLFVEVDYFNPFPADLEEGLVAHYDFDGDLQDQTSFNNDGILVGPTLAQDLDSNNDKAYRFDGIDDRMEVPSQDQINFGTGSFSISFWINPEKLSKPVFTYIAKMDGNRGWSLHTGGPHVGLQLKESSSKKISRVLNTNFTENEWQHVIVTVDRENNKAKVYKNGELTDIEDISEFNASVSNNFEMRIGRNSPFTSYKGRMDDVKLWNRTLNSFEVSNIYSFTNNCPIQDGETITDSFTFAENTICDLPNGFNIVGENIEVKCESNVLIKSLAGVSFDGSGKILNCNINQPN